MFKTLLIFFHLIATCAAIGTIVLTDLRLIAKVIGYRVVIPKPERLETTIISLALVLLYLTGGLIVYIGTQASPDYLNNEKLLAKLLLVALLTLNAVALHKTVFPILGRARPVSQWSRQEWLTVAACVSLSNSIWLFCSFLGIARIWNHTVSFEFVLGVAAMIWTLAFLVVNAVLKFASRDTPKPQPDWIDTMKNSLSNFSDLNPR